MEKILSTKVLFRSEILAIEQSKVEIDEKVYNFERVVSAKDLNEGVMAIPIDESGRLVFIEQFQFGVEKRLLVLPRGGIEIGQKPELQMQKELQEEIGYKAGKLTYLTTMEINPGYMKGKTYLI